MLTFTHTYLLNHAYKKIHFQNIPSTESELILGNVIPDFVTHLGKEQYQAAAHNLNFFSTIAQLNFLEWGAIFHILCDNYSTLCRLTFEGSYHELPKNGFMEKLSKRVILNIPLQIPKRRILQCAFDILVIREEKQLLINMLKSAASFLRNNMTEILQHFSSIYDIKQQQLRVGLTRFLHVYGKNFIDQAALEEYRLFPLIRNLLKLDTLTDPRIILNEIHIHSELMELIDLNMGIIKHNWHELLDRTVQEVMKYSGIKKAFNRFLD